DLWQRAAELTGVMDMAVGSQSNSLSNMSQLGKAYLCRYLKEAGFEVIALGDNMVDYYMLLEADRGYVIAHAKKNATLQNTVLSGTKLKQPSYNQTKFEGVQEVNSIHEDIE
ncbi:MAG: HAD hydrolase family protein, partial [Candidatus Methanomethylophilaceae archaeon]|nr:HAD hydrolase family protein [Candidatus Methanomethylophilaceae archaeon]